eukprot:13347257-Alexandrium_andersonii.AAC.1
MVAWACGELASGGAPQTDLKHCKHAELPCTEKGPKTKQIQTCPLGRQPAPIMYQGICALCRVCGCVLAF